MSDPAVLVIAGALSREREVSLRSGRRVADALREAGCEVRVADLDAQLLRTLRDEPSDLVWPVLHGASGEDGSVPRRPRGAGRPVPGFGATGLSARLRQTGGQCCRVGRRRGGARVGLIAAQRFS